MDLEVIDQFVKDRKRFNNPMNKSKRSLYQASDNDATSQLLDPNETEESHQFTSQYRCSKKESEVYFAQMKAMWRQAMMPTNLLDTVAL